MRIVQLSTLKESQLASDDCVCEGATVTPQIENTRAPSVIPESTQCSNSLVGPCGEKSRRCSADPSAV